MITLGLLLMAPALLVVVYFMCTEINIWQLAVIVLFAIGALMIVRVS